MSALECLGQCSARKLSLLSIDTPEELSCLAKIASRKF